MTSDSLKSALEQLVSLLHESKWEQRLLEERPNLKLYAIIRALIEEHLMDVNEIINDPDQILRSESFQQLLKRLRSDVSRQMNDLPLNDQRDNDVFDHLLNNRHVMNRSDSLATDDSSFTLTSVQGWPSLRDGQHYSRLAEMLMDNKDRNEALMIILALINSHSVDSLSSSSCWPQLLQGLQSSLSSSRLALKVHARLIQHHLITSPKIVADLLNNLVQAGLDLHRQLQQQQPQRHHQDVEGERRQRRLRLQLLNVLNCLLNLATSLPSVWYRYPLRITSQLIEQSVHLFNEALKSPLITYLAATDKECRWMSSWCHGLISRQLVLQHLNKIDLNLLLKSFITLLEDLKVKLNNKCPEFMQQPTLIMARVVFTSRLLSQLMPYIVLEKTLKTRLIRFVLNTEDEFVLNKIALVDLVSVEDVEIREELQIRLDNDIIDVACFKEFGERTRFRVRLLIKLLDEDAILLNNHKGNKKENNNNNDDKKDNNGYKESNKGSILLHISELQVTKLSNWIGQVSRDTLNTSQVALITRLACLLLQQPWMKSNMDRIKTQIESDLQDLYSELNEKTPTNSTSELSSVSDSLNLINDTIKSVEKEQLVSNDDDDWDNEDVLIDLACWP